MITIFVLYFFIGFVASTLGAMAGLGGGVIIKPVLDLFGHFDLPTIGVLSSATVFAMSATSLIGLRHTEIEIEKTTSTLFAIGSIVGGFLGKIIFNFIVINIGLTNVIGAFQSAFLAALLIVIVIFVKYQKLFTMYDVKSKSIIVLVAFFLGLISAFLGIGGGPLNVAILTWLFTMNAKEASVNSIFIIFFSQLASLILVVVQTDLANYNFSMLGYMIVGGILGGLVGSKLITRHSNKTIQRIFNSTILMILGINLINLVKFLIL
ncbi:sulfite exporter TauE/SafE family protein [Aquibacillus salsiterrae]|uniref:Probable membrane transporter protein n=1 Tax=Aquibacillus salsiterrae TaxID=2950439 RepID=A0A9X4AEU7_9BACI|nr:sulfite exporter TauE/SafE family protein [Aquibacillus salsiterrae]MDC3417322.1 sulfite exporter TauE/SafE family protein [Aquibacillus salsiterrae]